jgi:GH15 family glucan-1,4-alpha-glucosidase
MVEETPYPPLGDYAFIADCHGSALVSKRGSIDWCCLPRYDSSSCFGRLLDWRNGGYCQIRPTADYTVTRRYLPETLVLETLFSKGGDTARLLDCITMRPGGAYARHRQILRILEGISGELTFDVRVAPVFDYGKLRPWILNKEDHFIAMGGSSGLLISGDLPLKMQDHHLIACRHSIRAGERAHLSLLWSPPELLDDGHIDLMPVAELDRRLQETIEWWQRWTGQTQIRGPCADEMRRSAIILRGLVYAPTGAIAAAATTSLPEAIGGGRNWDYRFSWIRDSFFTIRSLSNLGYVKEAERFRRFVQRTAAGDAEEIQVLFGLGGERRLLEHELDLEGYRCSKPVRIGNAAQQQRQLDVYGQLVELSWIEYSRGVKPSDDYWDFLVELISRAAVDWEKPDYGIWEIRSSPRHFVHSKVECWSALDHGIRLAAELGRNAPIEAWRKAQDEIRRAVLAHGYDRKRGVFIQAFDHPIMDAALLLLPTTEFVDYRDERMVRTTKAIREDLEEDGFLHRYPSGSDDFTDPEGVFCSCSFWLAECLARQGDRNESLKVFKRSLEMANDLGIFSEEYDPKTGLRLGNLPQGLTHLSLITAALAIHACTEEESDRVKS